MSKFKKFWLSIPTDQRSAFASACDSSAGHLNNVAHGQKPASDRLSLNIERESNGAAPVSDLNPEFAKVLYLSGYTKHKKRRVSA